MNNNWQMEELTEDVLDAVTGGFAAPPTPGPTGGVTYKCPACGATISASTRGVTVKCPNLNCWSKFRVQDGKLIPLASAL